ncbi:carbapenem antibiotics biosynthesis protein CarD [Nonlabens ulvanivorans]|uniref:Carbapenem antibiotics biosynthesis protein CarD n=1 Tax=Nonlabens ulvanivorans TaxID=906888 RepID=A0A090WLK4_NONUL|nr:carbapenem antibiotics biosynthesis protein CarD [Nonlabens ulvanivorans]GAL76299.1 carbapenem antibiotics biosynthesis protein CarD [Nonlabens ulvanivorans]
MNMENPFNNTEIAFSLKSNRELRKAHFLFKMMGYPSLINFGSAVMMKSLQWRLPVKVD